VRPIGLPSKARTGSQLRCLLDEALGSGSIQGMEQTEAIGQMRATCNELGKAVTRLHPLVSRLNAPPAQAEILKALFELTKQVEVVKKHLIRLEKDDGNTQV
jgi:iron-sulfur cluster repair protein YtfE (RIC family)